MSQDTGTKLRGANTIPNCIDILPICLSIQSSQLWIFGTVASPTAQHTGPCRCPSPPSHPSPSPPPRHCWARPPPHPHPPPLAPFHLHHLHPPPRPHHLHPPPRPHHLHPPPSPIPTPPPHGGDRRAPPSRPWSTHPWSAPACTPCPAAWGIFAAPAQTFNSCMHPIPVNNHELILLRLDPEDSTDYIQYTGWVPWVRKQRWVLREYAATLETRFCFFVCKNGLVVHLEIIVRHGRWSRSCSTRRHHQQQFQQRQHRQGPRIGGEENVELFHPHLYMYQLDMSGNQSWLWNQWFCKWYIYISSKTFGARYQYLTINHRQAVV